jgi:hypothetical protein
MIQGERLLLPRIIIPLSVRDWLHGARSPLSLPRRSSDKVRSARSVPCDDGTALRNMAERLPTDGPPGGDEQCRNEKTKEQNNWATSVVSDSLAAASEAA